MKRRYLAILFLTLLLVGCASDVVPSSVTPTDIIAEETRTPKPTSSQMQEPCAAEEWSYLQDLTAQCEAWKLAKDRLDCDFRRLLTTSADQQRIEMLDNQYVLDTITSNPDFNALLRVRLWLAKNRFTIIPSLIELINDKTEVGLTNADDLIIAERIDSGDLTFHAHGWVINDDLFQVSGRASWLLKEATGMDLGSVSIHSSAKDLTELQIHWQLWYSRFDCK